MASFVLYSLAIICALISTIVASKGQLQYVAINDSALVQCGMLQYDHSSTVDWFKGDVFSNDIVSNMTHHNYTQNELTGDLVITQFDSQLDSGPYTCRIEDSNMRFLYSCPIYLHAAKIDAQFIINPSNVTAIKSFTAVLQCKPPLSTPSPRIYWEKDGYLLSDPIITTSGNLYIPSTNLSDSGYYRCVAVNPVTGTTRYSSIASLIVTELDYVIHWHLFAEPTFIIEPSNVTVVIGEPFHWECLSLFGTTWKRLNSLLPTSADNSSTIGILNFTSVTASDGGVYRCSSGSNVLSSDVRLTVVGPPKVKLSINYEMSNITISCISSTPSISGKVNATLIIDGDIVRTSTNVLESFTFDITNEGFDVTDSGSISIQCIMSNWFGCDYDVINMTIKDESPVSFITPTTSMVSTMISSSPTPTTPSLPLISVNVQPKSITIDSTGSAILTCTISVTNTVLDHSLLQNLWALSPVDEDTTLYSSDTMIISQATVSKPGQYTCFAYINGNIYSDTGTVIAATITPPTLEPLEVTVSSSEVLTTTGTSTDLICIFNKLNVQVYWIKGIKFLNGHTEEVNGKTYATLVVTPEDMTASGVYSCTGLDLNLQQVTGSISLNVISLPQVAPHGISGEWIPSQKLLSIIWSPLNDSNVIGYKLNWGLHGQPLSQSALAAVSSNTRYYQIYGLSLESTYIVKVWAYTIGGDGPAANIQKFLTTSQLSSVAPVAMATTTATLATPIPSSSPTVEPTVISLDSCERLTPFLAKVNLKTHSVQNIDHYLILYQCKGVGRHLNKTVYASQEVALDRLQPDCDTYTVIAAAIDTNKQQMQSSYCNITSQSDLNPVTVSLNWTAADDLVLSWYISSQITSLNGTITVEMRLAGSSLQWMPVEQNHKLLQSNNYQSIEHVEIRIQLNNSTIYSNVFPVTSPPEHVIDNYVETWLTYGTGITVLLFVSVLVIGLILALKYIQRKRREKDKITDHRQQKSRTDIINTTRTCCDSKKHEILYTSIKRPHSKSPSPAPTQNSVVV